MMIRYFLERLFKNIMNHVLLEINEEPSTATRPSKSLDAFAQFACECVEAVATKSLSR